MDALRDLIAQNKRKLADIATDSRGGKIIKMTDVLRQRETERKPMSAGDEAAARAKNETTSNAASTAATTSTANGAASADTDRELSRPEVIRRLRARSAPILLFGETAMDAQRRLRKLEIEMPELKEGWKNDFQSAMNKVDEEFVDEVRQLVDK